MALLNAFRRLSPFQEPEVLELPGQELTWPSVGSSTITIDELIQPEVSGNFALAYPDSVSEVALPAPEIVDVQTSGLLDLEFDIIDVLESLGQPESHGTIFVKREKSVKERGERKTRATVEAHQLSQKIGPAATGLDIFEMLLPVLMPPAATEFGDELLFPHELYDFQRAGVKWLFENNDALLADDMGLGKTVQAITAFRALIRRSKALQALVVCPKSVLANWMHEIEKWAPELVAIRVHGNRASRRVAWNAYIGKCHVLVTTYDTVRSDQELIRGRVFDVVIADEVQRIKNPRVATSRAVRDLSAHRHWALTGTPLENRLEEIVAVFDFVRAGLFQASDQSRLSPRLVRERIEPFMLRRRKQDVLSDLPQKILDTKWIDLGEAQRRSYDRAENEGKLSLQRNADVTVTHVLQLIQYLKQVCNFDPESGESVKLEFLKEEYLPVACQDDQKALIFSQYTKTLDQITHELDEYGPLVYTGHLSTNQRSQVEEAFKAVDQHRVLLLSLRAGGVGLNLTRASYVLHFDRWWNPAVETQAEDRVHRIGQTRQVVVTRLICTNTIEERIEKLLEEKRILFESVVDDLADVKLERVLSEEELFGLFGLTPPRRARAAREGGPPAAEPPSDPEPIPASGRASTTRTVRPDTPFSNLLEIRRMIRSATEYLWWADPHFQRRALEELIDCVDPAAMGAIRILSGPAHIDRRARRDFKHFREELQAKGIESEWRVLERFSHDRFILSANSCFNVPPVNSLFQGAYSQINETESRPPFEEWWGRATPLDELEVG